MINTAQINAAFNAAFNDAQRDGDTRDMARNYAGMIGSYEALILSLVRDEGDVVDVVASIGRLRQRMNEA